MVIGLSDRHENNSTELFGLGRGKTKKIALTVSEQTSQPNGAKNGPPRAA
jgi:hypothetical protein